MGGGDLNLKKSWHPSTLRNIERVWKAEQKHEAEQQKIEQLQKELAAERARDEIRTYAEDQGVVKKRDERLDWMYQGPVAMVSRDDYLMGRKIDKTFDILLSQESGADTSKHDEAQSGSLFQLQTSSTSDVTVDLATKIREDPLFAIMKKEKEQKKNLLNNPVKMKQLQMMLKDSLSKKSKHKKKKSKKRHQSESSSSSESEYEKVHKKHKAKSYMQKETYVEGDRYCIDKETSYRKHKQDLEHSNYHSSSSKRAHEKNERDDIKGYSPSRKEKKLVHNERYPADEHRKRQDTRNGHMERNFERKTEVKKKLSESDKERKRQEMMDNAKWRDKQRERNVQEYIKQGKREDYVKDGSASNFIKPMLSKAAERGTVENRVKQKIFSIQRKTSDMDRNFARR